MGKYFLKNQVKHRVAANVSPYWANTIKRFGGFADEVYYLPSLQEIQRFHKQNPIAHAPGAGQGFDCDDFSFVYKGMTSLYGRDKKIEASMCVGIVWGTFSWMSGYHACNWVLCDDFRFFWIEPQSKVNSAFQAVNTCRGNLTLVLV